MPRKPLSILLDGSPVRAPQDLARAGRGSTLTLTGSLPPRDVARWAGPLGSAVLRGAVVVRV